NHDPLALEIAASESHPALVPGGGGAFSMDRQDGEVVVLVHEIGRSALKGIDLNHVATSVAEAVNRNFGLTLYDLVLLRPGTLPRTTSGKVQRFACREHYLAGQLASIAAIEHPALGRCRPGQNN
ncbi:MAG TPA: hypothetical protein VK779_01405, partial [Rhizomicrobium sp.]|nr:hypothetical protein [Rhizomicrobium sp.]